MISFYNSSLRFDLPVIAFKDIVAMVLEEVTVQDVPRIVRGMFV